MAVRGRLAVQNVPSRPTASAKPTLRRECECMRPGLLRDADAISERRAVESADDACDISRREHDRLAAVG